MKTPALSFAVGLVLFGLHSVSEAQSQQFTARLDGGQEEPTSVTTTASGTGVFELTSAGLRFNITVNGLSGPIAAAHFHNGRFGVDAGVVRTITGEFVGNTAAGIWTSTDAEPLTPLLLQLLRDGDIYVNIHTSLNPGGEIRGQLVPSGRFADLDQAQEVPVPVIVPGASGLGFFTLSDSGLAYNITARDLSGPVVAAHFHNEAPGVAGPIVRDLAFVPGAPNTATATGTWTAGDAQPLTPALVQELRNGRIYVNVHTALNPTGEIRGQVDPTILGPELDGAQEVPPLLTGAKGVGLVTLTPQGVRFNVTVSGLTGPIVAAHFHNGPRFQDGPIVRTITADFVGNAASGIWTATDPEPLTPGLIDALKAGNLYLNVHTAANPGGEVRGQIVPPILFAAVLPSSRSVQIGTPATAFGTIINAGAAAGVDCDIAPGQALPADFVFQTTNPATNAVTGAAGRQVDLGGGAQQSFVIAFTPTAEIAPADVPLVFTCGNSGAAPSNAGLNTLLLSASATPTPDIVALAATLTNDGIVNIPGASGAGAFAVATVNVGATGLITALADTGGVPLPVTVTLCETNPTTGQCMSPIASTVTTTINNLATPTFGIFVSGTGNVPFSPAANRIFVRFRDAGSVTRGSTGVAVRTQ